MDPSASIQEHENDDVFSDALDSCLTFNATAEDLPESTVSDPQPVLSEPGDSLPTPPSPASIIRRRPIRRGIPGKESSDSGIESSISSDRDLINGARRSFRHRSRYRNLKEDENLGAKPDSDEAQQVSTSLAPIAVTEENNDESTLTTAANDDAAVDSADSAPRLSDSSSNFLEFIAGLVIKALGFQIHLIYMFVTYPLLFIFHCCMFCIDPFGTARRGKDFLIGILCRVHGVVFVCISPFTNRLFKENESIWSVAFRFGWGFLWSIYVCCILFGLLVSSFVFSGFLMKCLVEKPIQIREVLNFDYTKHSPVAYVPIISCAGVDVGKNSESNVDVRKWMGERVIPSKRKVQVTVSLRVPDSGYNRNLGVFQARVDFLLSNGKTIASLSQPCMLRFTSEPIRLIMTFLKIAPLVTGYISESQTLNVKMRGFVEGNVPTSCLKVTLEQRAEYQPGAGIPEIYDASLVIESELPFFKRIIWLWKMTIFIWTTMMAFVTELFFVLLCCRPLIIPRTRQRVTSARGPAT
ncbi:seipin-2 [Gastrolobium bilobum]|uniref:seipin-2 n=1 Tax=Gastrolobium bilobum TaxID=150636 RepID=UPI002AB183B7|nr:seipin-2 [Gastrolobium bilobum]